MGTIKYNDLKTKLLSVPEIKQEYEELKPQYNKLEKDIIEGLKEAVYFAKLADRRRRDTKKWISHEDAWKIHKVYVEKDAKC